MPRTPSRRAGAGVAAALALAAVVLGCGGGSGSSGSSASRAASAPTSAAKPSAPVSISLTSPVLTAGRPVPKQFTCDGMDDQPPLRWSGVPAGTAQLALLLEDLSARGDSGDPFVHWSLFAIPPSATQPPAHGVKSGTTDFHQVGYGGPCPPDNDPAHHYVFTLYALRSPLDVPDGSPPADVRAAIARAGVLAEGRLEVTYTRGGG
jgi:Raf kinase inhibitor-like YbhB/YbcL family protein